MKVAQAMVVFEKCKLKCWKLRFGQTLREKWSSHTFRNLVKFVFPVVNRAGNTSTIGVSNVTTAGIESKGGNRNPGIVPDEIVTGFVTSNISNVTLDYVLWEQKITTMTPKIVFLNPDNSLICKSSIKMGFSKPKYNSL